MQHHDHGSDADVHVNARTPRFDDYCSFLNRHVEQYDLNRGAHVILVHPADGDIADTPAALVGLALDLIDQRSAADLAEHLAVALGVDVPGVAQLHDAVGGDAEQWDPELEPGYRPGGGSANDPDGDDGRRNGD